MTVHRVSTNTGGGSFLRESYAEWCASGPRQRLRHQEKRQRRKMLPTTVQGRHHSEQCLPPSHLHKINISRKDHPQHHEQIIPPSRHRKRMPEEHYSPRSLTRKRYKTEKGFPSASIVPPNSKRYDDGAFEMHSEDDANSPHSVRQGFLELSTNIGVSRSLSSRRRSSSQSDDNANISPVSKAGCTTSMASICDGNSENIMPTRMRTREQVCGPKKRATFASKRQNTGEQVSLVVPAEPPQFVALVEGVVSNHLRRHYVSDVTVHGRTDLLPTCGRAVEVLPVQVAPGLWTAYLVDQRNDATSQVDGRDKPTDWSGVRVRLAQNEHLGIFQKLKQGGVKLHGYTTTRIDPAAANTCNYPDTSSLSSSSSHGHHGSSPLADTFIGALGVMFFDGFETKTDHSQLQRIMAEKVLSSVQHYYERNSGRIASNGGLAHIDTISMGNNATTLFDPCAKDSMTMSAGVALPVNADRTQPDPTSGKRSVGCGYYLLLTSSETLSLVVAVEIVFTAKRGDVSLSTTEDSASGILSTPPLTELNLKSRSISPSLRGNDTVRAWNLNHSAPAQENLCDKSQPGVMDTSDDKIPPSDDQRSIGTAQDIFDESANKAQNWPGSHEALSNVSIAIPLSSSSTRKQKENPYDDGDTDAPNAQNAQNFNDDQASFARAQDALSVSEENVGGTWSSTHDVHPEISGAFSKYVAPANYVVAGTDGHETRCLSPHATPATAASGTRGNKTTGLLSTVATNQLTPLGMAATSRVTPTPLFRTSPNAVRTSVADTTEADTFRWRLDPISLQAEIVTNLIPDISAASKIPSARPAKENFEENHSTTDAAMSEAELEAVSPERATTESMIISDKAEQVESRNANVASPHWPCFHDVFFGIHDEVAREEISSNDANLLLNLELETLEPEFHDALFAQLSDSTSENTNGQCLGQWILSIVLLSAAFPFLLGFFHQLTVELTSSTISELWAPLFVSGEGYVGTVKFH